MDLSGVLDWLETAPIDDVDRVVRIGARVARDRRSHLAGTVRPVETRSPRRVGRPKGGNSIEVRGRDVLAALGRPATLQEVIAAYSERFGEAKRESIRTTLSRKAQIGHIFTKSDEGLYGLLEWKGAAPGESSDAAPTNG